MASTTGSLYLHCDPTASHYLKIILDAIFNPRNFQNEVVWKRTFSHNRAKRWGPIHDAVLFYSKTDDFTWNRTIQPYDESYVAKAFTHHDQFGVFSSESLTGPGKRTGDSGKVWEGIDPDSIGRHWEPPPDRSLPEHFRFPEGWSGLSVRERLTILNDQNMIYWPKKKNGKPRFKRYLSNELGLAIQDIVTDIPPISSQAKERMGYPTQKPITLLERIIKASSNESDTILDPFCGCGTAIHAAQRLNRNWTGIDVTHLAIGLIEKRMRDAFGIKVNVRGTPNSFDSAKDLARRNKFQFEAWAVTLIPNVLPNTKQVGDKGVDGRGYIHLGKNKDGKRIDAKIIVSVKGGGNLTPSMVRDLAGTMSSEKAKLGVFVCLKEPTRKMREAAVSEKFFSTPFGESYPRLQIYTISDYFNGIRPNLPSLADFVKAPRSEMDPKGTQTTL